MEFTFFVHILTICDLNCPLDQMMDITSLLPLFDEHLYKKWISLLSETFQKYIIMRISLTFPKTNYVNAYKFLGIIKFFH